MTKPFVMEVAVISTAHLKHNTYVALTEGAVVDVPIFNLQPIHNSTAENAGLLIWVGEGLPVQYPDVSAALAWAAERDYQWLRFFADGDLIPELKNYGKTWK